MIREPERREALMREMRHSLALAHNMAQRGHADLARNWERLAADYLERALQLRYETLR